MARFAKVSYDEENDILYASYGNRVKDSLEIDKFVLDFSGNEIVGVEIFDASKIIRDLSQNGLTKEQISKFEVAKIRVVKSKELVYFVVMFFSSGRVQTKAQINIPAPMVAVSIQK